MTVEILALTPAHNEAQHLEGLIESMVGQELRPRCWVIVNDASSDDTGVIAHKAAAEHDWIKVLDRERGEGRRLSSKADAVSAGYQVGLEHCPDATVVASVDADIELPPNTFSFLTAKLDQQPKLGITGGIYLHPVKGEMKPNRAAANHVPGPLQVFRREVFDAVGGYKPLNDGGLDVISTAHARMLGWETKAFDDLHFTHNRRVGTGGDRHPVVAEYHNGIRDYSIGTSFLFELVKCGVRLFDSPILIASATRFVGYMSAVVTRRPSSVPDDVAAYIRREQLDRILPRRLTSR